MLAPQRFTTISRQHHHRRFRTLDLCLEITGEREVA
jgi:hypothetical protein